MGCFEIYSKNIFQGIWQFLSDSQIAIEWASKNGEAPWRLSLVMREIWALQVRQLNLSIYKQVRQGRRYVGKRGS